MAQKMTGALVFDERTDRYDIRFDLNSYYGGLGGLCLAPGIGIVKGHHLEVVQYEILGKKCGHRQQGADDPDRRRAIFDFLHTATPF